MSAIHHVTLLLVGRGRVGLVVEIRRDVDESLLGILVLVVVRAALIMYL